MQRMLAATQSTSVQLRNVRFISAGLRDAKNNSPIQPSLPSTWAPGDLFVSAVMYGSPYGRVISPNGWNIITELSNADGRLYAFTRQAQAGDIAPLYVVSGGTMGDGVLGGVAAFRGVDPTEPIAAFGPDTITTTPLNDVPVRGPGYTGVVNGGVLIIAARNTNTGTSVIPLKGDGLTWTEVWDFSEGQAGFNVFLCANFAGWSGVAPVITDKVFSNWGTSTGTSYGKAIVLRAAAL